MVVMFRFQNVVGQIFRVAELAHIGGGREEIHEKRKEEIRRQDKGRKEKR